MSGPLIVEYEKVEAFRIGLLQFTCVSKWNGLEEWQDQMGQKLIVQRDRASHPFSEAFAEIFCPNGASKLSVIAGAPDILHALMLAAKKPDGGA